MAKSVYVLNGPNLNLLGTREPETYGRATLKDVEALCREAGGRHQLKVEFRQSNHEGEIVDAIHEAHAKQAAGIVINAGAYTHTSIAIRDAIGAVTVPVIEVHISNVFARESFRHLSHIAPVAKASLCGFGIAGYALAIDGLAALIGARRAGERSEQPVRPPHKGGAGDPGPDPGEQPARPVHKRTRQALARTRLVATRQKG
jgi:3-dehydroquinate dehydratase-2